MKLFLCFIIPVENTVSMLASLFHKNKINA